jgi:hypothetical protein
MTSYVDDPLGCKLIENRAFARSLKYMDFIFLPENMFKKLLKSKISDFWGTR